MGNRKGIASKGLLQTARYSEEAATRRKNIEAPAVNGAAGVIYIEDKVGFDILEE